MILTAGPGAVREILVVLAVALSGLLLALIAAFTPWYDAPAGPSRPHVVELQAPPPRAADTVEPNLVGSG
ncbi:hypothetical protein [Micromonospora sp. NBC_01796]|uniref:hypothetical protein n=1 Tax=Micromonospora sp. NBC_01796 TaxID=2975987 RepID=UPI002DD7FC30|nr:hypothetical protein [Micromonospora sp. NBC_01796]WSA89363.1 hypothetical protein OIE47_18120 [Micromonospora sp. NBC_01796]